HLGGLFAGIDFHPVDLALATVGLLHSSVHDLDHDGRDIGAGAITFDVRNDGLIRHVQREIGIDRDFLAPCGNLDMLVGHECSSCSGWFARSPDRGADAGGKPRSNRAGWRTTPNSSSHWRQAPAPAPRSPALPRRQGARAAVKCQGSLPYSLPYPCSTRPGTKSEFFVQTWRKHRAAEVLTPLESMALDWVLEHPEYHGDLEHPDAMTAEYPVE